jgi:uncharacterized protein
MFVEVPFEALSEEALNGLIEEFVTRDGTDYGAKEHTLEEKKDAIKRQLRSGHVVIVFDPEAQSANIIKRDQLE